jgi:hypothetical protein
MRSLVTAALLALGAVLVTAATPAQAQANWRTRYYSGYYAPSYYYAPSVAYVNPYSVSTYVAPTYMAPTYVAPAYNGPSYVAPYASFSMGTYGWGGPAWYGGYPAYYRGWR